MVKRMYGIYDVKSGTYGNPVFVLTDGEAIRMVADACNDTNQKNMLAMHPQDFKLYYLGDFNQVTGEVAQVKPALVIDVAQLVVKVDEQ